MRAKLDRDRRLKRACGSAETYDRLKAIAFDDVARQRGGGTANLDLLASGSTVRMVAPVAKSRDDALNITVCTARMIVELPPRTQAVFGSQRLEADVEYAAQEAADGSGLVYRLQGAEPIIARIATSPLERLGALQAVRTAEAPVVAVPAPRIEPSMVERQQPPERTTPSPPRPVPAPPRPAPAARATAPAERLAPPEPARAATRPSFNCRYAHSRSEQRVCADPELAVRDRRMSSAFYAALARGDARTKAALRTSRDRFLRYRDRCPTSSCIAEAYADRIEEIRDIEAGQ